MRTFFAMSFAMYILSTVNERLSIAIMAARRDEIESKRYAKNILRILCNSKLLCFLKVYTIFFWFIPLMISIYIGDYYGSPINNFFIYYFSNYRAVVLGFALFFFIYLVMSPRNSHLWVNFGLLVVCDSFIRILAIRYDGILLNESGIIINFLNVLGIDSLIILKPLISLTKKWFILLSILEVFIALFLTACSSQRLINDLSYARLKDNF
jgi:hypothetical protein